MNIKPDILRERSSSIFLSFWFFFFLFEGCGKELFIDIRREVELDIVLEVRGDGFCVMSIIKMALAPNYVARASGLKSRFRKLRSLPEAGCRG